MLKNMILFLLTRDISISEEAKEFAKNKKIIYYEVSAKTGDGFSDLFYKNLFEKIRTKFRPGGQQPTSEVKDIKFNIEKEAKKNVTKKGCCQF